MAILSLLIFLQIRYTRNVSNAPDTAETILALDSAKEEINKLDLLFDLLPSGAEINETTVSLNGITLIIHTDNSAILSEFLAKIVSSGIYSGIGLISLQYNQFAGFILELMLSG